MGPLHAHLLFALAPPRLLHAARLRLYHEALHLHDVEEQLAHQIGVARVGHLETGTEPLIAGTVAERDRTEIEQLPPGAHGRYHELTVVVLPAAHIRPRCTSQLVVPAGRVALTAPLRVRRQKPIGDGSLVPLQLLARYPLSLRILALQTIGNLLQLLVPHVAALLQLMVAQQSGQFLRYLLKRTQWNVG
uniref:Putative secreted protein n=1 Tax=Anopheles triannulatus TaxID=58253 RepID=A0A2M4B1E1_9DIPT